MSKDISVAVYEAHGKPEEVLQIRRQPWPRPAADEVVIEMRFAPINPADLNAIEGKYPGRREVPAVAGFEGAGVVVEKGADVREVEIGALVIPPHDVGTWREALAVKGEDVIVVPREIDPQQAAVLKINPSTAWRMLHDYVSLRPGDWFIQNAANSAAGIAAIQIAHDLGYKSVNVVRRAELIDELKAEGADVVLVDGENLREDVKAATAGAPIRLALNAVGGDSALRLANCLAPEATMVTFGAMSLQPLKIPNGLLIFKNLHFCGIWINKWFDHAAPAERAEMFEALFDLARRGKLRTQIARTFPLNEAPAALNRAAQNKREGKILFELK